MLGTWVGFSEGVLLGCWVGDSLGVAVVGFPVGTEVGNLDGVPVGLRVGDSVGVEVVCTLDAYCCLAQVRPVWIWLLDDWHQRLTHRDRPSLRRL